LIKKITNIYCEDCKSLKKSVYGDLNSEELNILNFNKSCNFYKKGQTIYFEGNTPEGLFCIREGKVKIYKTGNEGKEQIIRLVKNGDIIGYRALIAGESYNATAETLEDSKICFIRKNAIFDLLKKNEKFSFRLIKLLSHDLGEVEQRMVHLAQKPVRERLAETLLILRETYGMDKDNNSLLNVSLSREDLANIAGTATETVIRLLAEFKNKNIISTKARKIEILDVNKLIETGNLSY